MCFHVTHPEICIKIFLICIFIYGYCEATSYVLPLSHIWLIGYRRMLGHYHLTDIRIESHDIELYERNEKYLFSTKELKWERLLVRYMRKCGLLSIYLITLSILWIYSWKFTHFYAHRLMHSCPFITCTDPHREA